MTTVQRNNRYPRTTFSRVGIGKLFTLTPNGTVMVKVDNRRYAALSPSFSTPGTNGVIRPTGPVPYYTPPIEGLSPWSPVYDPKSNPVTLLTETTDGETSVIEADPPFFKGQSSYLLSGTFDSSTGEVSLSWTYPDISLIGTGPLHAYVTRVILQRSTSTRATPFGPVGDGPVNANVNTVQYSDIPADPEWTTLVNDLIDPPLNVESAPPYPDLRDSYTDTPPITSSSHVFHYRLIVLTYTAVGTPPQPPPPVARRELDWNVVTIITPYTLTVNANQPRLKWVSPSASELASLSGLFLNSFSATRPAVSATPYTTTTANFTVPAPGVLTSIQVASSSWATSLQGQFIYINGAGYYQIGDIPDSTHVRVYNLGTSGNAVPTTVITSGKSILAAPLTYLDWVFDLPQAPVDYTLQRRASELDSWATIATLANTFTPPFIDASPPSPTLYYKLIANMSDYGLIHFAFTLPYTVRSVT